MTIGRVAEWFCYVFISRERLERGACWLHSAVAKFVERAKLTGAVADESLDDSARKKWVEVHGEVVDGGAAGFGNVFRA
jgi:hypothetical protein